MFFFAKSIEIQLPCAMCISFIETIVQFSCGNTITMMNRLLLLVCLFLIMVVVPVIQSKPFHLGELVEDIIDPEHQHHHHPHQRPQINHFRPHGHHHHGGHHFQPAGHHHHHEPHFPMMHGHHHHEPHFPMMHGHHQNQDHDTLPIHPHGESQLNHQQHNGQEQHHSNKPFGCI